MTTSNAMEQLPCRQRTGLTGPQGDCLLCEAAEGQACLRPPGVSILGIAETLGRWPRWVDGMIAKSTQVIVASDIWLSLLRLRGEAWLVQGKPPADGSNTFMGLKISESQALPAGHMVMADAKGWPLAIWNGKEWQTVDSKSAA